MCKYEARKKLCHLSRGRLSDLAQIWGLLLQWGLLQVPHRVFTFQRFFAQESQVCSGILGNPGSIRTAISNSNNVLGKKSVTLIHWIVVVEIQCSCQNLSLALTSNQLVKQF